ncbi:aspartyl protease family protein [Granulicella cerasi]|uniref:Aspartyl protease family protein n=1 Tax=Granulicella cerasi TaxID=741063 RepID=A0ABW1Z661_9BACT|nr:aspartyl protease family protein [Granulicella cerasi]
MKTFSLAALSVASLLSLSLNPSSLHAQAPVRRSCAVITAEPTEGETMISSHRYKDAELLYQAAIAKDASNIEDHLGLVRAYIGEDMVPEARAASDAMLKKFPDNSLSLVAQSEMYYRAGNADEAQRIANKAVMQNPCDARAHAALANVAELRAFYATAAHQLDLAARLSPHDELIHRDWMFYQPRKKRLEELEKYLTGPNSLAEDEKASFNNIAEHLKARHVNECHITSTSETAKAAMAPMFGDSRHPIAYGLDVSLNGKRRRMQIDTGASGILLTKEAAHSLGLKPEIQRTVEGVGDEGSADSYLTHVKTIRIGDVQFEDCMVEVYDDKKSHMSIDGLIGMDVFQNWLVTLDYPNATLRLAPLPKRPNEANQDTKLETANPEASEDTYHPQDAYVNAPELKGFIPVARIGHDILLPSTWVDKKNKLSDRDHYLIMDTGASATNISPAMAKEIGKLHGSDVEFTGLSGKVKKVWESDYSAMRVANLILPGAEYFVLDNKSLSHNIGFETDGLFGLPTLQRLTITIDYRDNMVKLNYDPNHDIVRF